MQRLIERLAKIALVRAVAAGTGWPHGYGQVNIARVLHF